MQCLVCAKALTGKQKKFCSRQCKNRFGNNKYQSYVAQQARGKRRREKLVALSGGCCVLCGYKKFLGALHFHHKTGQKNFQISIRECSNRKWKALLAESLLCELVCANCHAELHYYT